MPLVFGYARVSTDGQTLEAQVAQLEAAGGGTPGGRVYREKVSGAARERPQLARLLEALSPGDVVLVTRLDRLARSTRDLLNVLGTIAEKGAAIRSIGDPWADTTDAARPAHADGAGRIGGVRARADPGPDLGRACPGQGGRP